jgi:hypothetical protein
MNRTGKMPFAMWWQIRVELRLQTFGGLRKQPWWARPIHLLGDAIYWARRRLQGARPIELGKLGETHGFIEEPALSIAWGGVCPVQGDGVIDGRPCYYRSRGEGWQLYIAADGSDEPLADDAWIYSESRYFTPDGGYVASGVSERCIRKAALLFRYVIGEKQ